MTRIERLDLTKKLLADRRLSDAQIADVVGRSKRWVRKVAREHPRWTQVQSIAVPALTPNVAITRDTLREKRASHGKSRYRQLWRWIDWIGSAALLGFYAVAIVQYAQPRTHARAISQ